MEVYRQEMAAVVCVFGSGEVTIVSAHHSLNAALDALAWMRESGEASTWMGDLRVFCNGACHADFDLSRLEAERVEPCEDDVVPYDDGDFSVDEETGYEYER